MTTPDPIHRALEEWREANERAEVQGRAVLDAIRADLERLNEMASEAKKEGRRGGLSKEADEIEAAIRNARSSVTPGGREPEKGAGESVDVEQRQRVSEAREKVG